MDAACRIRMVLAVDDGAAQALEKISGRRYGFFLVNSETEDGVLVVRALSDEK